MIRTHASHFCDLVQTLGFKYSLKFGRSQPDSKGFFQVLFFLIYYFFSILVFSSTTICLQYSDFSQLFHFFFLSSIPIFHYQPLCYGLSSHLNCSSSMDVNHVTRRFKMEINFLLDYNYDMLAFAVDSVVVLNY